MSSYVVEIDACEESGPGDGNSVFEPCPNILTEGSFGDLPEADKREVLDRLKFLDSIIALGAPMDVLDRYNVNTKDPKVLAWFKFLDDGLLRLAEMTPEEQQRLSMIGRQRFEAEQDARKNGRNIEEGNFSDGGAFYGNTDGESDAGSVAEDHYLSSRQASAYVQGSQARTAAQLENAGTNFIILEREDQCDKCKTGGKFILCRTCDSVNGCLLCPACDASVHVSAQDHTRCTLTIKLSHLSPSPRGRDALFLRKLGPSEFIQRANPHKVENHFSESDVVVETLPSSFFLKEQLSCGCWRAAAHSWLESPFKTILSINGIMQTGIVTHMKCSCNKIHKMPSSGANHGIDSTSITSVRTRCAVSSPVMRVIEALQSGDKAPTAGAVQQIIKSLCGYAPPPATFTPFINQTGQMNTLAFCQLAGGGIPCMCCHKRPGVLAAIDASCAAFRFKSRGFATPLVTSNPLVLSDADTSLLLFDAEALEGENTVTHANVCSVAAVAGCSSSAGGAAASTWTAAGGASGAISTARNDHKDEQGIFVTACVHGVTTDAVLMSSNENFRYHLAAVLRRLPNEVRSQALWPTRDADRSRGLPTMQPAVPGPAHSIVQSDIACLLVRHLIARLRRDPWYVANLYGVVHPLEDGRAIKVTIPDYALRPGSPTIVLEFGTRVAGAIGDSRLPAGLFTLHLHFIIGGMHSPGHCCCYTLHQFDLVGLPQAATAAEPAEWATNLMWRNALQSRPLSKGMFRLFWEAVFKRNQRTISFSLPLSIARAFSKSRATLANAHKDLNDALEVFNNAKHAKVDKTSALRVVEAALKDYRPPAVSSAELEAQSAKRLSISNRILNIVGAKAILQARVSFSRYTPTVSSPTSQTGTSGALAAPPLDAGAQSQDVDNSAMRDSTEGERELYVLVSGVSSEELKRVRSFDRVNLSAIKDPRQAVITINAMDKWLAKQAPVRQLDLKTMVLDQLAALRTHVTDRAALRVKGILATKKNGEGDGQVLKIAEAVRTATRNIQNLWTSITTRIQHIPQFAQLKLPPVASIKGEDFDDVKYVPLFLQPPKMIQESLWGPLFVAVRMNQAAEANVERVMEDVVNSVRTIEIVLKEVNSRIDSLSSAIASSSDVDHSDLATAAGSSLLFVPKGVETSLTPFTVPFDPQQNYPLLARGLLSLLCAEEKKWRALLVQLIALEKGLVAVQAISSPPNRLPVDRLNRSRLGQSIADLLNGSVEPTEWAKSALADAEEKTKDVDEESNEETMPDLFIEEEDDEDVDSHLRVAEAKAIAAAAEVAAIYDEDGDVDEEDAVEKTHAMRVRVTSDGSSSGGGGGGSTVLRQGSSRSGGTSAIDPASTILLPQPTVATSTTVQSPLGIASLSRRVVGATAATVEPSAEPAARKRRKVAATSKPAVKSASAVKAFDEVDAFIADLLVDEPVQKVKDTDGEEGFVITKTNPNYKEQMRMRERLRR